MRAFIAAKKFNILPDNEAGVSLIEILIALALLGIIGVAFLGGLTTASKATFIADERATAESLVRSQMEYVKSQGYINYADHEDYAAITTPTDYSVETTAMPIDPDTGQPLGSGLDQGIQKITVAVQHGDTSVRTLEGYKAER